MAVFNNNLLAAAGAQSGTTTHTIGQSIRFNDDDNPYLSRTLSTASDGGKTYTFSWWQKLGSKYGAQAQYIIHTDLAGGNPADYLYFYDDNFYSWHGTNSFITDREFRDASAWYHFVYVYDSTQAVASERLRLYVNGIRETSFSTENYPSLNATSYFNTNTAHYIGGANTSSNRLDAYMAEIHFLDGLGYDPSFFGEFNSSGIWIPKKYTGSYGSNGFFIKGQLAGATNAITALGDIQHSTAQAKIGSSSILFDGNGDLLEVGGSSNWYDFGADGNPWTMEAYIRFDTVSITQKLFWQNNTYIGIEYVTGSGIKVRLNNGGINFTASWSPSINTWYHVAVVRQTNNTTTVYIDGTSIGSGTISGGSSASHKVEIGAYSPSTDEFDGYMDEIRISSVARFTSSFTPTTSEYTADGDTLALIHSNTTNGSTVFKNDVGFGNDSSGNQNNFATSGLAAHDQMLDTPTNNFCVMNPNNTYTSRMTLADGNLQSNASSHSGSGGTILLPSTGKWYVEFRYNSGLNNEYPVVGVYNPIKRLTTVALNPGLTSGDLDFGVGVDGRRNEDGTKTTSWSNTITNGKIGAIAIDMTNKKIWFGHNNSGSFVWQGSGDPSSGTNEANTKDFNDDLIFGNSHYQNSNMTWNFGQDGTFAGTETAQNNSDANGVGNFYYAPPTGYLALCTKNMGA